MRDDVQKLIDKVSAWEGIRANPHRFGGVEFNLGKVEIGHVHGNGMVDIPFTRKLREQLVNAGEAEPHHLLSDSGWITFYMSDDEDVGQALRLMRLSYLQKVARRKADILPQPLPRILLELGFNEAVNAILVPNGATRDAVLASQDETPPDETDPET
jgi:hypothetical protein